MSSAVFLSTEGKKIVAEHRAMARGGFAQRRATKAGPVPPPLQFDAGKSYPRT
jgi:hypothetical protein